MASEKLNDAIDLSHHISELSKARLVSPLKGLAKYMGNPNLIALAGGMPHPSYFPFADISANALVPDSFSVDSARRESSFSWVWKLFGAGTPKEKTAPITVPKFPTSPDDVNLAVALQYGTAQGLVQLQKFLKEFVQKVYKPAYANFTTLVHTGNTDGWSRAVMTLCNPGEMILTEEWTYPSALYASHPFQIKPVAIAMDSEGMRADDLRKVLSEWDEKARGAKRPHVMYTVPVGQNPSGATMGGERKKAIYDICVEYDIIIVEDDPYYFLQEGVYKAKEDRPVESVKHDANKFLAGLAPTYLKFDYQGRVVRLDTFSKSVAPGSRLGWFTCSPQLAERLERQGETSTQAPCGFGQSLITQLLLTWGYDGWVRWLNGLAVEYKNRRDFFIDTIAEEFHLQESHAIATGVWAGCNVLEAYLKPRSGDMEKLVVRTKYFSFVAPSSGMFVWIKMHFESMPSFKEGDEETLEVQLWEKLAEAGVLIAPGWYFNANDVVNSCEGHYRISFSNAEFATMRRAITVFGEVVREFFKQ